MTNAVASSSKRPAPSSSINTANKAKRPRPSTSSAITDIPEDDHTEDVDGAEGEDDENVDDDLKAKIARKEARTIRNRESAQRSRNQRKAHLAHLEQRVIELEAENRALKGDSYSPATPSSFSNVGSNGREASPAQSVISLANDLGIPSELVNGTGVKLSNVAPPPADLELEDVKPVIHHTPSPVPVEQPHRSTFSPTHNDFESLRSENVALRERVSLLENLVKQVVAVANFSGLQSSSQDIKPNVQQPTEIVSPITANNIDWSSFLSAPVVVPPTTGLEATLSPPFYPSTITDIPIPTSQSSETQSLLNGVNSSNAVARHPAEVATMSSSTSVVEERLDQPFNFTNNVSTFNNNNNNNNSNLWNGQSTTEVNWENGNGVNTLNNWDEAMKNLIEDIEGRNNGRENEQIQNQNQSSSVLGMEWFGNTNGSVVV
ncbi:uncharacterized protein L201_001930 [Kwoniella dendrophila CBS 6074]|uniref:BZIP domain-containing protein n=1 Tax=Kwoniella dendrophila CBS 6074 TaxID=1295534 RepID=A0AAX4JR65_9TREE